MIQRLLASAISPAGPRSALSILIFHRVLKEPDPLFPDDPDCPGFERLLQWLVHSFNVLRLEDAVRHLAAGSLPARAVAITFDDGYRDNFSLAMPALLKHRLNATFFIATGFLDGGRMWNDTIIESLRQFCGTQLDLEALGLGVYPMLQWSQKKQAMNTILSLLKYLPLEQRDSLTSEIAEICAAKLPVDLMMTSEQVREMRAAGMSIGAHTRSHPILARLDHSTAQEEIMGSKEDLEKLLGEPVTVFAYPNGKPGKDYHASHVDIVRAAGFTAAVSTSIGVSRKGTDILQLPRFTPWDQSEFRFGLRLINNMRREGKSA